MAVEAVGDDLLGVVDRDAAERVDELAEAGEVDQHDVVDLHARQVLHGLDRQRRAAERVRGVDAVVAVAGDRDAQVARDRELRDAVACRIDAHEQDRVRAPRPAVGPAIGAEHERRRGVREQRAAGRQRRSGGLVDALVGVVQRAAELRVAVADPEHEREQHAEHQERDQAPEADAPPAGAAAVAARAAAARRAAAAGRSGAAAGVHPRRAAR